MTQDLCFQKCVTPTVAPANYAAAFPAAITGNTLGAATDGWVDTASLLHNVSFIIDLGAVAAADATNYFEIVFECADEDPANLGLPLVPATGGLEIPLDYIKSSTLVSEEVVPAPGSEYGAVLINDAALAYTGHKVCIVQCPGCRFVRARLNVVGAPDADLSISVEGAKISG